MTILREFTNSPFHQTADKAAGGQQRIDRENGIIYAVKIIGCSSKNNRFYPNETLRQAIPLYENAKVNLNHPDGSPLQPRNYQDRFGIIQNVFLKEDDGLYADFRFNPKHPLAEQLLWDAENVPENAGFSHNVEGEVRYETVDGNKKLIVDKITAVRSVDLVADPATTAGLFESAQQTAQQSSQPIDNIAALTEELRTLCGLLRQTLQQTSITEQKPVCKEQTFYEPEMDAKDFVKRLKMR
jgi:hypothetical protein